MLILMLFYECFEVGVQSLHEVRDSVVGSLALLELFDDFGGVLLLSTFAFVL